LPFAFSKSLILLIGRYTVVLCNVKFAVIASQHETFGYMFDVIVDHLKKHSPIQGKRKQKQISIINNVTPIVCRQVMIEG